MKHRLKLLLTFVFMLVFLIVPVVFAGTLGPGPVDSSGKVLSGWNNMGSGWWHNGAYYSNLDGSIQAYTSNEFGALMNAATSVAVPPPVADTTSGCTGFEGAASCHPEWTEALANCVSGSYNASANTCTPSNVNTQKAYPSIAVCSATNMTGSCRPERVNPYAAANIAKQAQTMGTQKGYSISCSATKTTFGGIGTDSTTNLTYYMNTLCTVNGMSGVSAEQLVTNPNAWTALKSDLGNAVGNTGGTTIGSSTTGGTTTTVPTNLPASTASLSNLNATVANLKNQSITYIRQLMNVYTKQLESTKAELAQSFATNVNAVAVSNNTQTTATNSCTGSLNSDLRLGSTSADVSILTTYLTSKGFLTSPYVTFDQTVYNAVIAFQEANAVQVLYPVGLSQGTGFVGPSTRNFINKDLCAQTNTTNGGTTNNTNFVFSSNASGTMHVGDAWNVTVTGLNPNETIYATGGKKVNGVIPSDRTPYTANSAGILVITGTHVADVVGDWQTVWTRMDGTILGTLTFKVDPATNTLPTIVNVSSTTLKAGDTITITGTNIIPGTTLAELVDYQGGIISLSLVSTTSTTITATLPSTNLQSGSYKLQLRTTAVGNDFGKTSNIVLITVSQ